MASQKQKKSLSKSKLAIMSSTLTKGEPIRRKHKAIVLLLCATVITIAITSTVRMVNVQQANQKKLEQIIQDTKSNHQIQLKKQNEESQNQQQKLQQEIEQLKKQVEAKKQSKIAQAVKPVQVAQAAPVGGTKADWMRAAGIPENEWSYVDSIVTRESGWNPNAVNKSSGACGLGQQLPCGKWAGAWNDPVAALRAMSGYVKARYGGWAGAVAFWNANRWY